MDNGISLNKAAVNKNNSNIEQLIAEVDFCEDLKKFIIELLCYYGVSFRKKDSLLDLLKKYFTFRNKFISPQKREVYMSAELTQKLSSLPEQPRRALDKMQEWIQQGIDINCFQSSGLYGNGSRDYQNILYGMVHLHLSASPCDIVPKKKKNGFSKRSEYLLFALFNENSAFFVDVVHHPNALSPKDSDIEEWTSSKYIKIIENNWPKLSKRSKVLDGFFCDNNGNRINLSDKDIANLTVNGISTIIEGNRGAYLFAGGSSANGDSSKAVIFAQKTINAAKECQCKYIKNIKDINDQLSSMLVNVGKPIPNKFDIHYDYFFDLNKFEIVERNSGAILDLTNITWHLL